MKVLQITNYYYPNYGGIEQVAHDIAKALSEKGAEQKIICANSDAKAGNYVCHANEDAVDVVDGVEVIRCKCIVKVASQSVTSSYPKVLKETLRDMQPDYVILHYPNPYTSCFVEKYLDDKCKLILYWHSDIVKQQLLGKFFTGLEDRLAEKAYRIVATSPNYIDGSRVLSKYRNKTVVIPNSVDEKRLNPSRIALEKAKEIRTDNSGKTICFAMGRHVPYKGFEYLINAAKMLDDEYRIILAGVGPLTDKLKEKAGNDSKIQFAGRLDEDDLIANYLACDMFCFPSITKNEAFGVVLAEAMYFGKPAITFTIPGSGVNYVNIDRETGIECPNRDEAAFADAIRALSTDQQYREDLGNKARQRVIENFTYSNFKEKIYEICN